MPQDDASLGHRVTLFTTNHQENSANGRDASRIVFPVSLGHSEEPNGKWVRRRRQDVTRYSPAVIPEGSMRDFWLATTPLNADIENGRATQGRSIVESRNGRKAMQASIEQYMDPEKIHDHLSGAVDEIQASNDAIKRVGMACYEDLSNDKNFCHRRMIAEKLSKKIGVPIPDISHLKIFQEEKGQQKENPLKFYEDTILNPMRAIAAREGLDLSKDKDTLAKIFEKELPDLGRLNAIIAHWDSQREEPLASASAPDAPGASRQVTDQLDDSKDTSIQHDYPHANITAKSWKSIFSNFSPRRIIYTDDAGEQIIAPSSESLYQAMKLKPNSQTGGLSDEAKLIAGMTPREAKQASRSLYRQSPDSFFPASEFELKKIESMKKVLQLKAEQHPEFLDALLATGNEQIVESTGSRDPYWGVIDTTSGQKGRNVQGKLLMQIRDEIRANQQGAPSAPAASSEVKEGIKGDITNPDFQKSGGYNMIVNTCNTVLNSAGVPVMGRGIAKDFRDKYKDTDYLDAVAGYLYPRNMTVAAAQRAFGASWMPVDPAPGSVFVHQPKKADGTPVGPPIASLFVKRHWQDQARRDDTNGAITALREYLDNNSSPDGGPWKVAMPHIAGLNGQIGGAVEGSVGSTDGWKTTRQHIIDTFDGSPHEAHIIDFDGGTSAAPASLSGPRMPFDQRSGVTSIQKTLSHPSVQDPAFISVLQRTDWQKQFFDSVNAGKYSAYLADLKTRNGYTPEQIAAISLKIRQANIDDLKRKKGTEDLYSGASIADDGSTVLFDNPETMERLKASEPTLKRVMVSNHGIYLESEKPKRTNPLQFVRENLQYNHYRDDDGRKLYQQTKRVNYAEYEPGLWYSDIKSYSPGTPSR